MHSASVSPCAPPEIDRLRQLRTGVSFFQVVFGSALLLGAFALAHGVMEARRDRPSLAWPTVTGTVLQSEWAHHTGRRTLHVHQPDYYYVTLTYAYEVGGTRHSSHQIQLWNPEMRGRREPVQAFVSTHPVDSTVTVYYDPQHPENSALIPGADESGIQVAVWVGCILVIVAIVALIRVQKTWSRAKRLRSYQPKDGL